MRREERVTVQGSVKEQQPDGMSHRGLSAPSNPRPPEVRGWRAIATRRGPVTRCPATPTPFPQHGPPRRSSAGRIIRRGQAHPTERIPGIAEAYAPSALPRSHLSSQRLCVMRLQAASTALVSAQVYAACGLRSTWSGCGAWRTSCSATANTVWGEGSAEGVAGAWDGAGARRRRHAVVRRGGTGACAQTPLLIAGSSLRVAGDGVSACVSVCVCVRATVASACLCVGGDVLRMCCGLVGCRGLGATSGGGGGPPDIP